MSRVRTRKRGKTYSFAFEAGKTASGGRRVIEKGGYPTEDAAYEAGIAAYADFKQGNIGAESKKMTLTVFSEIWLRYIKKEVQDNTYYSYHNDLIKHILPILGNYPLKELQARQVSSMLLSLRDKGLARRTLIGIRNTLSQVLTYAIYPAGILQVNPVSFVKVPRAPEQIITRTIISPERFADLMKDFPPGNDMHVFLNILYYTGIRLGEALGLLWEDVDFDKKLIHIRQQKKVNRVEKFEYLGALKTKQSVRDIYMNDRLIDILKEEKDRQKNLPLVNVIDTDMHCYSFSYGLPKHKEYKTVHPVCVNKKGAFLGRNHAIHRLHSVGLNAHSFRHTQATMLIESGASPKAVANRLGHATTKLTMDLYTHNTERQQKEIADIINQKDSQNYTEEENDDDEVDFFDLS